MMQKCVIINDGDNIFASNINYNLCSENLGLGCILTFFLPFRIYSVYILGRSFARICFLIMMLRRCCCKIVVYNNSLRVRVRLIKDVREAVTACN